MSKRQTRTEARLSSRTVAALHVGVAPNSADSARRRCVVARLGGHDGSATRGELEAGAQVPPGRLPGRLDGFEGGERRPGGRCGRRPRRPRSDQPPPAPPLLLGFLSVGILVRAFVGVAGLCLTLSADFVAGVQVLQLHVARQDFVVGQGHGGIAATSPLREQLIRDLTALGNYPALPRKLAISSGRGDGARTVPDGAQTLSWVGDPWVAAELRARVTGFLQERRFDEGADVTAGVLLFVLEKDQYQAIVDQRAAELAAFRGRQRVPPRCRCQQMF